MAASQASSRLRESRVVDVDFGDNVAVEHPVNLSGCRIGGDSFIGPFCEIQRNARLGQRCKVQSHTLIGEFVEIGDDCFIGHGVMFVNDLAEHGGPAGGSRSEGRHARIGNRVSIGSNATILPVRIADGVVVGAGAVVTSDLQVPGVYAGNPARCLRAFED